MWYLLIFGGLNFFHSSILELHYQLFEAIIMILFLLYSFSTAYGNIVLISINSLKCDWELQASKGCVEDTQEAPRQ